MFSGLISTVPIMLLSVREIYASKAARSISWFSAIFNPHIDHLIIGAYNLLSIKRQVPSLLDPALRLYRTNCIPSQTKPFLYSSSRISLTFLTTGILLFATYCPLQKRKYFPSILSGTGYFISCSTLMPINFPSSTTTPSWKSDSSGE